MKPIRLHVAAEEELQEIRDYYDAKQPGLGRQWLEVAETAGRQLQKKPTTGRPARSGARKIRLPRFPYYLIFIAGETELFIVSFMHVKRDPDYWLTRL